MMERSVRGFELAMWAIWLGALWFMAILVAPGLFKWLARADAGLVAGRLFVMLSWYSVGATVLLALLSNAGSALRADFKLNLALVLVLAVAVVELAWMHPHMNALRASMGQLTGEALLEAQARFKQMHMTSSVLYSVKMIGALVWGLRRYGVKAQH
ncbi:MAG: DUF4149 domain-containing protein [Limnobacter sp.]|uniref:DUF4149 domain-containing protein n=1 Tax=Limnobacter sp. TaxID=2003368 RepID=UPI00391A537F